MLQQWRPSEESRQEEDLNSLEREDCITPSSAFLGLGCVLDCLERSAVWKCVYDSIKQCVVCAISLGESVCRSLSSWTIEVQNFTFISACGKVNYRCKTKVVSSESKVVPIHISDYGHNASVAFSGVCTLPRSHEVIHLFQAVEFATVYGTVADCLRNSNLLRSCKSCCACCCLLHRINPRFNRRLRLRQNGFQFLSSENFPVYYSPTGCWTLPQSRSR